LGITEFKLDTKFREQLDKLLELRIHRDAFVAMDYTIDWVYASLKWAKGEQDVYDKADMVQLNEKGHDIDLLVAYEDDVNDKLTHIIFIEAKGVTPWKTAEMKPKVERLKLLFHDNREQAVPHLVLLSPNQPTQLDKKILASWMLKNNGDYSWMKLDIQPGLKGVMRCGGEKNESNCNGNCWRLYDRQY